MIDESCECDLILIVDDDPMVQFLAQESLHDDKFQVLVAPNGVKAIELFEQKAPDLVLLDVMMPEMDGFECCKHIRQLPKGKDVPVLMMTGLDDVLSIDRAYEVGATDFTTKPINWLILEHRVRYMLRSYWSTLELKKTEKEIRKNEARQSYLANHDPLTGLPNRLMFQEQLQQALRVASRYDKKMSLLFLDLNDFKVINDTMGHKVGDLVLCEVAQRLKGVLRESDMVARLGGDEFVILLEGVDSCQTAMGVSQKLLDIFNQPMVFNEQRVIVHTSIGVASFPEDGSTADGLMNCADIAMYQAKKDGSGCYRIFSQSCEGLGGSLDVKDDLAIAIARDEFELYYQSIINMDDHSLAGQEALLRWNHPVHGILTPDQFVTSIRYSSEMIDLEKWIIEQAVKDVCCSEDGEQSLYVAVNISSRMFYRPCFVSWLESDIVKRYSLQCGVLQFDVNESVLMTNPKISKKIVADLSEIGVGVAVDDFGTGCTCLGQLKDVDLRSLKIDGQFVSTWSTSSMSRKLCEAVIAVAHCFDMDVVAEGIETEEQYEFLKKAGCNRGQGNFLGVPRP